jgi:hypothetical protein
MPAPQATRRSVSVDGTMVCLLSQYQITSTLVAQVPELPTSDDFVLCLYIESLDTYEVLATFNDYTSVEERFIEECATLGIDVSRSIVGKD